MKGVDEWPRGRQQACSKEQDLGEQRLTRPLALGVLSPDGISSSAYGTEEILIALLPLAGLAAFTLILPMTLVILFVMVLVLLSYREIVMVYIRPGGSYVVARENFGPRIAQICAVALLIDYIVTVAVQTAAGTAAVASAFPSIGPYKLEITVGVVLLMAFGNLRGLREAGRAFAVPTYVFSGSRRPAALQPPHRLRLRGQLRPGHAALRAEHAAHHDPRGALRHRQRPRRQAQGQVDPRRPRRPAVRGHHRSLRRRQPGAGAARAPGREGRGGDRRRRRTAGHLRRGGRGGQAQPGGAAAG
jgi:hypothetical protein